MTEQQRERDIAEMEAQMAHDTDQYFQARPQIMRTRDKETTFEAGFKAAWKARALSHAEGATLPENCRDRLQAEGKPYPKSGCAACGNGGLAGCPHRRAAALARSDAEQDRRIVSAMAADLGRISEQLGLDPDDGGAAPILAAIGELQHAAGRSHAEGEAVDHWAVRNPGLADQFRAEAQTVRKRLGFEPDADDVSPNDLRERIDKIEGAPQVAVPEVSETALRRAALFLDGLGSGGKEVRTLRKLLAATAPAESAGQDHAAELCAAAEMMAGWFESAAEDAGWTRENANAAWAAHTVSRAAIRRYQDGEAVPTAPAGEQPVGDPDGLPSGLTFNALRAANAERIGSSKYRRCEESWTPAHWMQATVGELGELANLLKKVDRGDFNLADVLPDVRRELADVQTYLDILALKLGVDLGAATIDKFNEVSERIGSHVLLAPAPDEREIATYREALEKIAPYPASRTGELGYSACRRIAREALDQGDRLRAMEAREIAAPTCEWSTDEEWDGDNWESECGASWTFPDGGPAENAMKFCPECGSKIRLRAGKEGE